MVRNSQISWHFEGGVIVYDDDDLSIFVPSDYRFVSYDKFLSVVALFNLSTRQIQPRNTLDDYMWTLIAAGTKLSRNDTNMHVPLAKILRVDHKIFTHVLFVDVCYPRLLKNDLY